MLGASGAVGGQVLKSLLAKDDFDQLTLLGRRVIDEITNSRVVQRQINIFEASTYSDILNGHTIAICTLGVGQPSKLTKSKFIKIDKNAVIDFARACKKSGIEHFQLLSSIGIDSNSRSFFLRTKGELMDELVAMNFKRLSIFQPSMILTPNNRYGFSQALTLVIWPLLKPMLVGKLKKYRGIKVETLGAAMALNVYTKSIGLEQLDWDDFMSLAE